MNLRFCLVWMSCIVQSSLLFASTLSGIRLETGPAKTSVYLTITSGFTHHFFILEKPERLVLDLKDTNLHLSRSQLALSNTLIRKVRTGRPNPKTLRVVFELNRKLSAHVLPWSSQGLRIDLMASSPQLAKTAEGRPKFTKAFRSHAGQTSGNKVVGKIPHPSPRAWGEGKNVEGYLTAPVNSNAQITHSVPITVSHSPWRKGPRDVVVVLDAGHGGKDPGARGPHRSHEKDLVLAITLKLKQLIDRQPGMKAVLTRSGDYYVGLRQRLDIARRNNGDVFVSIHADAFNNPHSSGASVYALSQRGATSEAARWIAEKENYSELGGVNLRDLDDSNGVVRSVLIDLSQTATIHSSLQMGSQVLRQLNYLTPLHHHGVEQAGFMVLKSTDIPSILVETGFISNPKEERNLRDPRYQIRLSQAIFQGMKAYFWDNPPHGTKIEAMMSSRTHVAKAGESLAGIAARYHVSLAALQALNRGLGTTRLKSGQKVVIPASWA